MRVSLLVVLPVCLASFATAQSQAPAGQVRVHIQGIDIPHVANAPFKAKIIVRWDQPLVGGGTVSKTYYTLVARDSKGRVRRETRGFVPAESNDEPPLRTFTITDPVSNTRTTCAEATSSCATGVFRPRLDFVDDQNNGLSPASSRATRESLGNQTMDGVKVIGTRETLSSMAGSHGSRRVALTSNEVWYSPDLHIDLSVVRSNPQLGKVTLTVTDLVRGEPDGSLLSVPSGYAMKQSHAN